MKRMFFFIFFILFSNSSLAIDRNILVTSLNDNRSQSFARVLNQWDLLQSELLRPRGSFENLEAFENRRNEADRSVANFEEKRFRMSFTPGEIHFEPQNQILRLSDDITFPYTRLRGSQSPTGSLSISFQASQELGRQMQSFKELCLVTIEFNFSKNVGLIIRNLSISYAGNIVYSE